MTRDASVETMGPKNARQHLIWAPGDCFFQRGCGDNVSQKFRIDAFCHTWDSLGVVIYYCQEVKNNESDLNSQGVAMSTRRFWLEIYPVGERRKQWFW